MNKKQKERKGRIFIKIFFLFLIILLISILTKTDEVQVTSQNISLLAVSNTSKTSENISQGNVIPLILEIREGSGNSYINLDTIEEIDTQLSIRNSQAAACSLFKLECEKYDFYYTFKSDGLILKGASGSLAIGLLVASSLQKEPLNKNTTLTGTLSFSGLVGHVGSYEEKIDAAKKEGFSKVIIPYGSKINKSYEDIELKSVLSVFDAYSEMGGLTIPKQKLKHFS